MSQMFQEIAPVTRRERVADNIHILRVRSRAIATAVRAGQFLNIRTEAGFDPLLRRAYSVHRVIGGEELEIIFNVVGKGSAILAAMSPGQQLDIMGPLGVPFHIDEPFDNAILVSGGVGIAPMPLLGETLQERGIPFVNIHGARTSSMIVDDGRLANVRFATDDGSLGLHGNVVTALEQYLDEAPVGRTRIFACGPNPMLLALGRFCQTRALPLEVSLECQMACGVGICQGCPVEMTSGDRKYSLVCTHGPNYEFGDIVLESIPSVH
jgi:dihydroorotate dehydrogenase electron transfer subunit